MQVRDSSVFRSVTSLAQFQAAWRKSAPSKATLAQFSQILSSTGGSIVYLSRDRQTVGIAGTTESLAGFPGKVLDLKTGLLEIAGGAGIEGGILVSIGAATGPIGWVAIAGIVLGGAASGVFIGAGIFDIFFSDPAASLPPSEPIQLPEITIYGQLPPDVTEGDIGGGLPPIDMGGIPDLPPLPPPNGGVPPPTPPPPEDGGAP